MKKKQLHYFGYSTDHQFLQGFLFLVPMQKLCSEVCVLSRNCFALEFEFLCKMNIFNSLSITTEIPLRLIETSQISEISQPAQIDYVYGLIPSEVSEKSI